MDEKREPSAKFRLGFVTAAVWKNSDNFYNVTLQRSYKDDDGKWQNTDNLNHGDLLNASKVLERAEAWIARQ
jgi:hypothetical protein